MIGGGQALARVVDHILMFLPVIPERELHGTAASSMMDRQRTRLTLVRSMHSWATNEIDSDLAQRVGVGQMRSASDNDRDRD